MNQVVLLTAATEDTEQVRKTLGENDISVLHCPLEHYELIEENDTITETLYELDQFENIVHGSKRNAQFFIETVKKHGVLEEARQQLNLALDQVTADYLEEEGIPAIHPHAEGKAINLMEFMLRVRRIGDTLYPCGDKTAEDLPGLLRELDIPVQELVLFTLEGPGESKLEEFRKSVSEQEPTSVIFHSRRSVNRILAAFPDLHFQSMHIVTGDKAVTEKLEKEGIQTDEQAEGSWRSIIETIQ
ncbi:uroporphyrinogen-III synthase [Aliifodinibius salicampi]|uniref:Uroporphyrinogen-III synthase n=1 Tax=Fodinibius salicampi TaxID=1920655 RepID=A0ABT3PZ71_9BACT|nr:uroporphyrinogen-III synthase [Fodinibius salicampi]MCW9713168.1 uroporphyrinogen-III synthase [Fodinibius salicampi]